MEATHRQVAAAFALVLGLLAACAGPSTPIAVETPAAVAAPSIVTDIPPPPALEPAPAPVHRLTCNGPAGQGGAILCRTSPDAEILLDGQPVATADADGLAVIGLRRDAPPRVQVAARFANGEPSLSVGVDVNPRTDSVTKFQMDCNKIAPQTAAEKRHAEVSWLKKDKAFKTFAPPLAPVALIKPAEGPYSSAYGLTRTYVPKTKDCEGSTSVHNGQDIAIPTGTEIHAPMAGTVILADPDLYFEGGAVFLDLGRGLLSVTMHMSRIDVKTGDTVEQGQLLGLSGATGRVTGPHLHWAIKFRNVHSDDRSTDIWLDPLMMLDLRAPD